ncbi:hypothetical protein [Planktothrix sp.]|uniref:hypothetical protein n=1 Tax=Planktothrix sp. TaxID=3088171 RepID=UPI0038D44EEC
MIAVNPTQKAASNGSTVVLEFQNKYNLSDTDTAFYLGLSEQSIKKYRRATKTKKQPSESVVRLAKLLDYCWTNGINPEYF